ncbi:MAG: hypothetical protein IPK72_17930 [Candidatus Eisenbacteria bacterium]|nr:hypothetical protein [Candidatus Eisenbacteria bacterium]
MLLLVALWLLVVYPIGMVLALPRALIAPRRDDTARYRNYLRRYAARLARNDTLRASYTDMPALETALRSARDEASLDALSSQVTRALDHLDRIANQRIRRSTRPRCSSRPGSPRAADSMPGSSSRRSCAW